MGKQFRFIMNDEDQSKLIQKVLDQGIVLYKNNKELVEIDSLPNNNWLHLYFVKSMDEKLLNSFEELKYIDVSKLSVLEFRRTYVRTRNKEIQRGRLYFENKYYENEILVYKDKELEEWYKELIKGIKREVICLDILNNQKVTKEYISQSLVKYVEEGFNFIG